MAAPGISPSRYCLRVLALSWGPCALTLIASRLFAGTWTIPPAILITSACAPTLAALTLAPAAVATAIRRRPGWRWLWPSALLAVAALAITIAQPPRWTATSALGLIAPFGEEFGWKVLLLPAMLARFRPLPAALAFAALWIGWHLPGLAIPGAIATPGLGGWLAGTAALSLLMTALFVRTGGDVWIAGVAPHLVVDWLGLAGRWSWSPAQIALTALLAALVWPRPGPTRS